MIYKRFRTSLVFLLSLFVLLPNYVNAKESTIVIFDASGSMKKAVNGTAKIEIAREVMGSLMQDWNKEIDLGLMVYGHRSKACDDIEMLLPVGKPEPTKLLAAIKDIAPKGETPIGASLQKAAEKLNYIESPTTIILVSDGEESCQADPCAVAKELEKSGVNFTAHVIGFDVSDKSKVKAHDQLKCVAESTGGKFFAAKDAEGLKKALAETAKVVAEPLPTPATEVTTATTPTNIVTGLQLSAIPTEGAEPFSKFLDVSYKVYENKQDMDGRRNKIKNSSDAQPLFKLPAGQYLVSATRGNSTVDAVIDVKTDAAIQHTFNLNVGNLKLSALASENAQPFSKFLDVNYKVYEDKKDLDGKRAKVSNSSDAFPLFKLAARSYIVVASRGNARAEKRIEVKAGERVEASFNLNTGNLKLSALPSEGAEPFSKFLAVDYKIYYDKKDSDGKRIKVSNSSDAQPLFKLAAGKYVLIATRRDTNIQIEKPIEIIAGELLEQTVIISEEAAKTTETTPVAESTPATAETSNTDPDAATESTPASPETTNPSPEADATAPSETTPQPTPTETPALVPEKNTPTP